MSPVENKENTPPKPAELTQSPADSPSHHDRCQWNKWLPFPSPRPTRLQINQWLPKEPQQMFDLFLSCANFCAEQTVSQRIAFPQLLQRQFKYIYQYKSDFDYHRYSPQLQRKFLKGVISRAAVDRAYRLYEGKGP